jgi:hypothetical protein
MYVGQDIAGACVCEKEGDRLKRLEHACMENRRLWQHFLRMNERQCIGLFKDEFTVSNGRRKLAGNKAHFMGRPKQMSFM